MDTKHPSLDILGSLGNELTGRRIVFCVTGSVAAMRSPDIARLLVRHGADVYPVMSAAACRLIHPDLMHWATGRLPVTELTGAIEHVARAGNVETTADLVVIAPATANTIGKAAAAIDDTPVTTVVTTALGQGLPLLIVPAMHEPMYRHPLVAANIERLKGIGVKFVMPRVEEGKAKIADEDEILEQVINILSSRGRLRGKRFLVTAGRTVEYLDPVRVVTNNSSGKMGIAVAEAAVREGAEVTLICGKISVEPPYGVRLVTSETSDEMAKAITAELDSHPYDVLVAAAAVGDWKPARQEKSKISTHTTASIEITLVPTVKIIDSLKAKYPKLFLVAFRALTGLNAEELVSNAHQRMMEAKADLIAVNEVTGPGVGFESDTNELYVVDPERNVEHITLTTKREAATRLVNAVAGRIKALEEGQG